MIRLSEDEQQIMHRWLKGFPAPGSKVLNQIADACNENKITSASQTVTVKGGRIKMNFSFALSGTVENFVFVSHTIHPVEGATYGEEEVQRRY